MMPGIRDILGIMPEIVVASAACGLLLLNFAVPKQAKCAIGWISIAAVVVAGFMTIYATAMYIGDPLVFSGLFSVDGFSAFFKVVLYIATILAILLSLNYIKTEGMNAGEYYILMLFSLCGMMVMVSGTNLLSIYIGLELMSIPIYVLAGFNKTDKKSNEGAMKYVILGAFSSGILLYGISFIYGLTGTTDLASIATALGDSSTRVPALSLGVVMIVAGFGFKVAGVPFHMWAPDVYEGAPTPITAFMSVATKAAAFAVILRVLLFALAPVYDQWYILIAVISIASMAYGNFVAISQKNIKRMLAYSSIGHAGYALLGVASGTAEGIASVMFYMLVYVFMNFGAFAVIIMLKKGGRSGECISDYTGLAKKNKALAFMMLIFLFSLAGIPPLAGFMGKFYVFMALIHTGMIPLAIFGVLMSAVAAYFYIRIVMLMYMKEPEAEFELACSRGLYYVLGISTIGTLWLGIYPGFFLDLAMKASQIL